MRRLLITLAIPVLLLGCAKKKIDYRTTGPLYTTDVYMAQCVEATGDEQGCHEQIMRMIQGFGQINITPHGQPAQPERPQLDCTTTTSGWLELTNCN